jgi:hypothetical protein
MQNSGQARKVSGVMASPKMVKPSHPNPSGKDHERRLRDDFKGRARGNTANNSYYTSSGGYGTLGRHLQDDNRINEDIASHRSTMTTAPEANTIATVLLPRP